MKRKKPIKIRVNRQVKEIEVIFLPEIKMELVKKPKIKQLPAGHALGLSPQYNVRPKRGAKIKYEDSWKI